MYYRIECDDGQGPFSKGIYYDLTRWMDRKIKPMKYHTKHPTIKTKSWFTKKGYNKFKENINQMLNANYTQLKLVKAPHLDNIVAKGKIQVLQKVT